MQLRGWLALDGDGRDAPEGRGKLAGHILATVLSMMVAPEEHLEPQARRLRRLVVVAEPHETWTLERLQ